LQTISLGWLWTAVLLSSASWVARITGMSHHAWLLSILYQDCLRYREWFALSLSVATWTSGHLLNFCGVYSMKQKKALWRLWWRNVPNLSEDKIQSLRIKERSFLWSGWMCVYV
jgi:hypothetical protein